MIRSHPGWRVATSSICVALALLLAQSVTATIGVASDDLPTDDDGKLLPLEDGFPSEPITIWNVFGPEHPEAVRAKLLAEAATKYSPVQVVGRSMSAGPGAHYDAWRQVELQPEGTEGYNVFAISWSGLTSRIITRDSRGFEPEDLANSALTVDGEEAPLLVKLSDSDATWSTLEEMIDWANDNPKKLRVAPSNVGSGYHLNAMLLAEDAGFDFSAVPTDGQGEALLLLLGGGADVAVANRTIAGPHLESGRIEVILQWASQRTEAFPDVPASGELDYRGFPRTVGVSAHPETPEEHMAWLEELFARAAEEPEYRDFQANAGFGPVLIRGDAAREAVADMYGAIFPILDELGLSKE